MRTLTTDVVIPAPARRVWALVGDLENQRLGAEIAPRVDVSHQDGQTIRTLHLAERFGAGKVVERILLLDDDAMRLDYEILDPGPVPVAAYAGRLDCAPEGETQMRLIYEARFDAPDLDATAVMAQDNFDILVRAVRRELGLPPS